MNYFRYNNKNNRNNFTFKYLLCMFTITILNMVVVKKLSIYDVLVIMPFKETKQNWRFEYLECGKNNNGSLAIIVPVTKFQRI